MHQPATQPRRRRPIMRWLAIAMIILMSPIVALATTVAATGIVTVQVQESSPDGTQLYIPVPALLLDLAVFAAPMVIPNDELAQMRREVAPYRDGLRAMAESIESIPSGVLVEVDSRDEQVRIVKQGRSFHIEVQSDDADVSVSVPARLLSRSLDIL